MKTMRRRIIGMGAALALLPGAAHGLPPPDVIIGAGGMLLWPLWLLLIALLLPVRYLWTAIRWRVAGRRGRQPAAPSVDAAGGGGKAVSAYELYRPFWPNPDSVIGENAPIIGFSEMKSLREPGGGGYGKERVAVVAPLSAAENGQYGEKARRLAIMRQHGFPCPDGWVIGHAAFAAACRHWGAPVPPLGRPAGPPPDGLSALQLPADLGRRIAAVMEEATEKTGETLEWIVRSSAAVEDRSDRSMAGVFASRAGVFDADGLTAAVCQCWASAWTAELAALASPGERERPLVLNLLVQPFETGRFGGVLFTRTPFETGGSGTRKRAGAAPDGLLIEAASGGPATVVGGEGVEARVFIRSDGAIRVSGSAPDIVPIPLAKRLAAEGRRLAALFNRPQDVEWLLSETGLRFLQSRNITGNNTGKAPMTNNVIIL